MSAKIQDVLRLILNQTLPSPLAELYKRSGADLTKLTWAKQLESASSVPEGYKDFFDRLYAAGRPFPYAVLTPSDKWSIHGTNPEKLICVLKDEICVLEGSGKNLVVQCYPLDGINYVEYWTALLASSFKICGFNDHGVYVSSTLIFNSITDHLFTPILNRVRRAKSESTRVRGGSPSGQFTHLSKVNIKFMNYANHSLLGGERVIHSILQPEIREKLWTVLGKTYYRTVSPTHMTILTERELILIREEVTRRREDRYGGTWDYIPLRKVLSLSLGEGGRNLLALAIQLPGEAQLRLQFQASKKEEVERLLEQFKEVEAG